MADSSVQLPPNSTGQLIRVEVGDSTNQIPEGVGEEAVILTDAQGLFPGDPRQAPLAVAEDQTLKLILEELRAIRFLLSS